MSAKPILSDLPGKPPPSTFNYVRDTARITARHLDPNGVLVVYRVVPDGARYDLREFFSGRRFKDEFDAGISQVPGVYRNNDAKETVFLPSGRYVWGTGLRLNRCYRQAESAIRIDDPKGKKLTEKILLFVLDHPKVYRTNKAVDYCADGPDFQYRVVVMQPNFLALADGTFLATDADAGVVIRFDEGLRTRSSLLGKRLFILDPEDFWLAMAPYGGDRANESSLDWGRFHDALYRLTQYLARGE